MIPLSRRDLPPEEKLVKTLPIAQGYFWVDDGGRLKIALRYHAASLLNEALDTESRMTLLLDGLPAASERLYHMQNSDILWTYSRAGSHVRFRSYAGVAAVEKISDTRITGRLHTTVYQQQFTVLEGWKNAGLNTLVGEFTAVRDPERGQAIWSAIEQDGFNRINGQRKVRVIRSARSRPATQPATRPAYPTTEPAAQ